MNRVAGWVKRHPVWSSVIGGLVALFILAGILGEDPQDETPAERSGATAETTATKPESAATTETTATKPETVVKTVTVVQTVTEKARPKPAPQPKPRPSPKPKPAPEPAPTPAPAPAAPAGCAPGYSPCLPVSDDLDCGDIDDSQKPIRVAGDDPYLLDSDGDGVGCELG